MLQSGGEEDGFPPLVLLKGVGESTSMSEKASVVPETREGPGFKLSDRSTLVER